jgi:hypothetical protein
VVPQGKLEEWLVHRSNMHHLIQEHLLQAQDRMKKQADKHRFEREFAMGSMVYMKLQPYVQSFVLPKSYHKLSFKYFGPFKVLAQVGLVAYRLQLPPTSAIHPVVHVSQLKAATGFTKEVCTSLPLGSMQYRIHV